MGSSQPRKSATASQHSRCSSDLELAPLPFTIPSPVHPHQAQLEIAGFDAARAGFVARGARFLARGFLSVGGSKKNTTHPSGHGFEQTLENNV